MTLTKQQWYPHLTRNSFYILSPAKGIRSRRQIISGRLYVRLKGTYSLAEHFQTPVNKLNNLDVNYLKIARSIAGRTKRPRGTRVWEPELERLMQVLGSLFAQNFGQVLRNSKVKPLPTSGKKIGIRLGQRLPRRLTQHERSWQHVELIWCFICERESNTTLAPGFPLRNHTLTKLLQNLYRASYVNDWNGLSSKRHTQTDDFTQYAWRTH